MKTPSRAAFSLIELLVAVAIIAILAAIAVPNFLAAQVRSKVARTSSDLRTISVALEAYAVTGGDYPGCNAWGLCGARASQPGDPEILERLSTPTAYLTDAFIKSPFRAIRFSGPHILGVGDINTDLGTWPWQDYSAPEAPLYGCYFYSAVGADSSTATGLNRARVDVVRADRIKATAYILQSPGPMQAIINTGGVIPNAAPDYVSRLVYDPTNGTSSFGNLFRVGGQVDGSENIITHLAAPKAP
ncbi:prepilin-type N-terminal cleavage/methylation domain-containing protein [bacterium]|nr:prepilin-type N-terminal cleavage/methylation domain-containing protein [bacterium]